MDIYEFNRDISSNYPERITKQYRNISFTNYPRRAREGVNPFARGVLN